MPKDRDPVLASLLEDTSNDPFLEIVNPSSNQEIKMETLIPQKLVEEFDENFIASFGVIVGDTAFFQENHTENSEKNLVNEHLKRILKEHNYCNNTIKK